MRTYTAVLAVAVAAAVASAGEMTMEQVRVSTRDPRYFELADGSRYVPIGLNLATLGRRDDAAAVMERWLKSLSANGGNFARVWIGQRFYDVEHARSGVYDDEKARRLDALLAAARKHGVRLKLCIEYFRSLHGGRQKWAEKPIHHVSTGGPFESVKEFFGSDRGREQFKRKLAWFADRYGDRPEVFGWELWNEINACRWSGGYWAEWTPIMLAELDRLFPKTLSLQSLGSFDRQPNRSLYARLVGMKHNDAAQVHRYLDEGAALEVCHGPVDILAADAVAELLAMKPAKPVLLAESGAVQPRHTGPFRFYAKDTEGTILHDVLFAPFFAGAAGPGHIWHWDRYVEKNELWWQFARFAEAIQGIDPAGEGFRPFRPEAEGLRVYALAGKRRLIAWCRDAASDWRAELAEGKPARPIRGAVLDLSGHLPPAKGLTVRFYDPWQDRWTRHALVRGGRLTLPEFTRSLVVRVGG